jgi:signal transduction histidine kinase
MSLPDEISEYLRADFQARRAPLCFLIGWDYSLQDWWGDVALHGFEDLQVGENLLDRAPFLHGHLGNMGDVLPFVSTAGGNTIEVHIVPRESGFYVVIMDASREHDFRQQRQQIANEVRLLHASQQKLISRQRALIGELVEAKTELDHRRLEAERNIAEKNQFIAMMSHEFRTPLSSIINYADLALDEGTSIDDMRKSAEAIARASRHMHNLVDTVLDEARLEAGQLKLTERSFGVRALFDDLAAIMAPLSAEKGLSFAILPEDSVPATLFADDVCLRQILINLVGNAVKFTETGGVQVAVEWQAGRLLVTVADTGPGIDLSDQERIFEAFERGSDFAGESP